MYTPSRKNLGFTTFLDDYWGLISLFQAGSWPQFLVFVAAIGLGWWLYVPLHELMHAWGCLISGGTVERLEISPEYGAAILQQWFPYVAVGSDYAGQLTGFDTLGSDFIYQTTVLFPYILTLFPGVYLFRYATRLDPQARRLRPFVVAGFSLPMAYAPFISVFGDMYESASIALSQVSGRLTDIPNPEKLVSDDFFKLAGDLWQQGWQAEELVILFAGLLGAAFISVLFYWAGSLCFALVNKEKSAEDDIAG